MEAILCPFSKVNARGSVLMGAPFFDRKTLEIRSLRSIWVGNKWPWSTVDLHGV